MGEAGFVLRLALLRRLALGWRCADAVQLDVDEQGLVAGRDLVLDQAAAAGAEELAEHRLGVDEALGVAGVRVAHRGRVVLADAAGFVVLVAPPEVGGAPAAGQMRAVAVEPQRDVLADLQDRRTGQRPGWRTATGPAVLDPRRARVA